MSFSHTAWLMDEARRDRERQTKYLKSAVVRRVYFTGLLDKRRTERVYNPKGLAPALWVSGGWPL